MAELIECCSVHKRAYKKLVHDFAQGRIDRGVSEQLFSVLKNAVEVCTTKPYYNADADIEAFAL